MNGNIRTDMKNRACYKRYLDVSVEDVVVGSHIHGRPMVHEEDAGVIDENINMAVLFDNLIHQTLMRVDLADVVVDRDGANSERFSLFYYL